MGVDKQFFRRVINGDRSSVNGYQKQIAHLPLKNTQDAKQNEESGFYGHFQRSYYSY